jgi:glycosyltransferase involved in cell wall biosynthesis
MKIAQVAPLYERVPPHFYGGTERVVAYLTEELIQQGHELTLFASGDSLTRAALVAPCEHSLRLDPNCIDYLSYHFIQLEQVFQRAHTFDLIHFHIDYLHFPLSRRNAAAHVTTLHGRLDLADLAPLYREFSEEPVVSISDAQRTPLPWLNWQGTVHHGLPPDLYEFKTDPGDYLIFLGRVSPEKGIDQAIEIATRFRMPIKIAAKVDRQDQEYMEQQVRPLLDHPLVEFVGEVGESEKSELLANAYALLFPINWAEPFGMVLIESMACGTPVVAYGRGSVPEVIDDGVNGFIVSSIDESVRALEKIQRLDRKRCRQVFEKRFSAARMARDYVKIYQRLADKKPRSIKAARSTDAATSR